MNSSAEAHLRREHLIFEEYPVHKALAVMILPTVVSQIIHVVYNIADTWFVGLTNDPNAVAAVSLCLPLYNILTCISNMFGIGCASQIGNYLGQKRQDLIKKVVAVSFWCALLVAAVYAAVLSVAGRSLLLLIGAEDSDIAYAVSYMMIAIVAGGIPAVLATTMSHMVRATGDSGKAGIGLTLGALLNIGLDPLFMFVLLPSGHEVAGAAMATALSNAVSLVYFGIYFRRQRDTELYSVRPAYLRQSGRMVREIIRCGAPSFLMIALPNVSNSVLNSLVKSFGSAAAVAGLGIVRKIDSLAYSVNQGITQGMLPMVAYCYAAGNQKRMKSAIVQSAIATAAFSVLCTTASILFSRTLIRIFIRDAETIFYGASFLKILSIAVPIYSLTYVIIAVFQAVGQFTQPFILSLRRGILDTTLFFVIRGLFGAQYMFWGTPIIEILALTVGLIMLRRFFSTH